MILRKAKYIAVAVDTPEGTLSSLYVQEGNPIAILFGGSIETVGSRIDSVSLKDCMIIIQYKKLSMMPPEGVPSRYTKV